ncbi:MAG: class I SAM-dependent DNA methyltransferase [Proteobacteria bacterium]|nr:class I SAM-dependent DNA methyltransferase [Pseudomonadota bacterium]
MTKGATDAVEAFIRHWEGREGGQERANYALFLVQLCEILGVAPPEPAGATTEHNNYVFERRVDMPNPDGSRSLGRIDLYKRGCFVLEAKQSRQQGGTKEIAGQGQLFVAEPKIRGRRSDADRAWDVLMQNAKQQAEGYARAVPGEWPPFILVCDVGHVIEVYADFSGQGKNYGQFPDRQNFRIYLEDLRKPEIRERLAAIWTDPHSLDPARKSARVTREIAARLAAVSKSLERHKHKAEDVAMFLMRCIFTMFAEDVELLPKESFRNLLERCSADPSIFPRMVGQLWEAMDEGKFAYALEADVRRFNGEFFKSRGVFALDREEIGELLAAAKADWRDVDPSIFGTLIEQALDPDERRRLGAHFTPRSYVERLVIATVIEPLRADWNNVLSTVERQKAERRNDDAIATVAAFHETLCKTRILDPACGSGNFLYVSLELMKKLEGEVLDVLVNLGGQEALRGLAGHTVDPHQFLGLEINPRAAAIAELVLWIGYLQWHIRTKGGIPQEPILQAFHNIEVKDAVLTWDGYPVPKIVDGKETYPNAKRPKWPEAEFIVGNPPFIGKGERFRESFNDRYIASLWGAHKEVSRSADFVMYWWNEAAEILTRKRTALKRFGLVTTNSITQVFNRRVVERHLNADSHISLVFAIPDHPWTEATDDAAAVRIAMTVAQEGKHIGRVRIVVAEAELDGEAPNIEFVEAAGVIHSDLTIGPDITSALPLASNRDLASMGPALGGRGFVLDNSGLSHLGGTTSSKWVRRLTTGKDITGHHRNRYVIDVRDFESDDDLRREMPSVYQHLKLSVYPARANNNDPKLRKYWWRYRRSNETYFDAIDGLSRFVATVETTKHRVFVFVDAQEMLEHGVIGFGLPDAWHLGVLSSRFHVTWTLASGGTLEDRPRYNKDVCFDPFPFPDANPIQQQTIRVIAEELDAHRKRVLAEHPKLTLTGLYNVLEDLRKGVAPDALDAKDRQTFDDGQVLILKELHERLDVAVAAAYGWPADLADEEILSRLVALNKQRAAEEARGQVRWLRPDYQIPRFGSQKEKAELDLVGGEGHATAPEPGKKTSFPADDVSQTAAVMAVLAHASGPLDAGAVAVAFKQGRRVTAKVSAVLAALVRMGVVSASGTTFALRRVA